MLEDILQKYFGCKGAAFWYHYGPKNENVDPFTDEGYAAYEKLLALLHDLSNMKVLPRSVVANAIDTLDSIANG